MAGRAPCGQHGGNGDESESSHCGFQSSSLAPYEAEDAPDIPGFV